MLRYRKNIRVSNNFGYDYPHDYTLKPEITFPKILQLFNTSVLTAIKVTNPGAGYTSAPAVIIEGGGGSGAEAVAIVKNNRLSEVLVKDPGSGYSFADVTVTGNGLKDVQWVLEGADKPTVIPVDVRKAAEVIGLA